MNSITLLLYLELCTRYASRAAACTNAFELERLTCDVGPYLQHSELISEHYDSIQFNLLFRRISR